MAITLSNNAIANILSALFKVVEFRYVINELRLLLLRETGGKIRKKRNISYLCVVYNVTMPKVKGWARASVSPCRSSKVRKAFGFRNRSTEAGR